MGTQSGTATARRSHVGGRVSRMRGSAPAAPPVDKRDLNTYIDRARFYYRTGDLEKSIKTLQAALKVNPLFVPAHHLLAGLYTHQRDYATALEHYHIETQLQPHQVAGYF